MPTDARWHSRFEERVHWAQRPGHHRFAMEENHFSRFAPLLRDMTDSELASEIERPLRLRLNRAVVGRRRIEVAYFPSGPANPDARIAIVGLTPGKQQMRNALIEARRCLRDGLDETDTLALVRVLASFSGPMRANLVAMLDLVGVNQLLGLQSTASLWGDDSELVHFTSALQFPIFVDGANYSGVPSMFTTPLLHEELMKGFAVQAATLKRAIFVPLGPTVGLALELVAKENGIDSNRVLAGLPHPSGANAERIAFFLGRKERHALSPKVHPERLIAARAELQRKIAELASK